MRQTVKADKANAVVNAGVSAMVNAAPPSDVPLAFAQIQSPIGTLTLAADSQALRHVEFAENRHPAKRSNWRSVAPAEHPILQATAGQLREYFAGHRCVFELPLAPVGTAFQCAVWFGLLQIPFGQTWSYRDLASHLGKPNATRAVGAANGRNPLPIILPCHRVIGRDGSLTGFGGGLDTKAALLRLELNAGGFQLQS